MREYQNSLHICGEQGSYSKPDNHEQKKRNKYHTDPGRRENMMYSAENDEYTCVQGKHLKLAEVKEQKIKTGFPSEISVFPPFY